MKQTWKGIYRLLGTNQENKHKTYGHIKTNNEPVLDNYTLADDFESYFSFIAKNQEEEVPQRPYMNIFE